MGWPPATWVLADDRPGNVNQASSGQGGANAGRAAALRPSRVPPSSQLGSRASAP